MRYTIWKDSDWLCVDGKEALYQQLVEAREERSLDHWCANGKNCTDAKGTSEVKAIEIVGELHADVSFWLTQRIFFTDIVNLEEIHIQSEDR